MAIIQLPAIISAPRFRKDRSVSLSFSTRELKPEEALTILSLAESEGWLSFAPNENELPESPNVPATLDLKSHSEMLRNKLYVWYLQEVEAKRYLGIYDNFYKDKMNAIINGVDSKIIR
jgi:hypothetical protein